MPHPAAISAEQIRTTVLSILAATEMAPPGHAPPTHERFRKLVSVRKLRAPRCRRA
jgi:hypothetical protein